MNTRMPYVALATVLALLAAACGPSADDVVYTGYVEAELVYVAAPSAGWLTQGPVLEGQRVAEGDLAFTLDDELQTAAVAEAAARLGQATAQLADMEKGVRTQEMQAFEAQLSEANADLRLARSERDRALALVQRGVASQARGDEATARYSVAMARVTTAKANLETARLAARDDALVAAAAARDAAADVMAQAEWHRDQRHVLLRTAGTVEEVFSRTGEFVAAGTPVLAVLPDMGLKVRFFVPQDALSGLAPGDRVDVLADGTSQAVEARVTHIAREAEFTPPIIYSEESRDTLVFLVEAKPLNGTALRPGQPVDVRVP